MHVMDTTQLASELAELEGVEQQFDDLVRQIIENQRNAATSRIMEQAGATPSSVAESMQTLENALEKIEHNLRSQYGEFLSAQVAIRAEKLTEQELARHIAVLRDERVQGYLARTRTLERECRTWLNELVAKLVRTAVGTDDEVARRR